MYSSIIGITITGSGTSANGNYFSASTNISDAVVIGAVISSSYAGTASYALNGGAGPSVSASYASVANTINQVAKQNGDIEILLGGSLIPDLDYSYTLGNDPLSGPNKLQSVNTYDLFTSNIYGLFGVGDLVTLHGTASFANGADAINKVARPDGDVAIPLAGCLLPDMDNVYTIGETAVGAKLQSVNTYEIYTADIYGLFGVGDLVTLHGTASYADKTLSASYAPGSPSISSSYALTASYALNGGGGPSISASYANTSSYAFVLAYTSSAQTTGSYTLVAGDNGKVITFTNATTNSIVVPTGLPTNFSCILVSVSTGSVQVTSSGASLFNSENCYKLANKYAVASVIGYLPDSYILTGNLSY